MVLALLPLLELGVFTLDELAPELVLPGLVAPPWFVLDEEGVDSDEFVMLRLRALLPAPELEL